jgi:hypothetical protein
MVKIESRRGRRERPAILGVVGLGSPEVDTRWSHVDLGRPIGIGDFDSRAHVGGVYIV